MKALINDLLDFSRLDTKAKAMQLTDFNEILDDVTHNLKVAIKESKTQIEIISKMPALIVDSTQISQLFQNLINNAIKFRNQDITPLIKISAEEQPNQWVFKISDNGIGIGKEYYERIFIIFQRLNNRVEYPGTGIGLAICKKIVERHGGQIWLESEVGKGSTFFFSIKK
jgi:light-regulated signal transduction histidine kinase (bacteriophytochrome)